VAAVAAGSAPLRAHCPGTATSDRAVCLRDRQVSGDGGAHRHRALARPLYMTGKGWSPPARHQRTTPRLKVCCSINRALWAIARCQRPPTRSPHRMFNDNARYDPRIRHRHASP
jgi:hypothetical protein